MVQDKKRWPRGLGKSEGGEVVEDEGAEVSKGKSKSLLADPEKMFGFERQGCNLRP